MERLLEKLLIDYMNNVAGVIATMITDRVDYSDPMVCLGDKSFIDLIFAFLNDNFDRIKSEFGSNNSFLEIMSTKNQKYAICSLGKSMLITIAKYDTADIELKVYSVHLADRIESILTGEQEVSLKIPGIIRLFSKSTAGKIPEGKFSLKIIIVGNKESGKSSLVHSFVNEKFQDDLSSTIGFNIFKKKIEVSESSRINYIIWDTGGFSSEISPIKEKIYNFADAAIIVIDRMRTDNIKSIKRWINKINESVLYRIPIIIIGTKIDIVSDPEISEDDLQELANEYHIHYIPTSAKTGLNIKEAFIELTDTILDYLDQQKQKEVIKSSGKYDRYRISSKQVLALEDLEEMILKNLNNNLLPKTSHDFEKFKKNGFPQIFKVDGTSLGVKIENGKIVGLGLFNCELSLLPDTFENLIFLKVLSLRCNPHLGFPKSLLKLDSLEELDLSLTGTMTILKSINKLQNLKIFHLENNMISQLPDSFGDLRQLTLLNLENNPIRGLPYFFSNLIKLEKLYLEAPIFFFRANIKELPEYFGNLKSLEELYLGSNNLHTLPKSFGQLKSLKILDLSYNKLKKLPNSFGNLRNLEILNLENNKLKFLPDFLRNLTNLEEIRLINNNLHKEGSHKFRALAFKTSGKEYDRLMKIANACKLDENHIVESKQPKKKRIYNIISSASYAGVIAFIGLFTFILFIDFVGQPSFDLIVWIILIIALVINLFVGASIIPTISSYVKISVFAFQKQIYKLFDILVVIILIWAIRSAVKTALTIELIPAVNFLFEFTIPNWILRIWVLIGYNLNLTFLENLDLFLGHFFLRLFSTGLIFWALFRNGIGHIKKTAFDEKERKNIWLFLILGLFGAFSLAIMEYSNFQNLLSIIYCAGVIIGASLFIYEKNDRNKQFLLIYLIQIALGITIVWLLSLLSVIVSLIVGIIFIISFIFIRRQMHKKETNISSYQLI